MRRQYKMAFGGWLAATAAALGQTPPQQPAAVQPIRYVTPFGTQAIDMNGRPAPSVQYVAVQQVSGTAQSPITVQYVPVQNGQIMAAPMTATPAPAANNNYVAVQPSVSGPTAPAAPATMATNVAEPPPMMTAGMNPGAQPAPIVSTPTNLPPVMNQTAPAPSPTTMPSNVQYIQVQPVSANPGGPITSQPMIQYVPVQTMSAQQAAPQARPAAPAAAQPAANAQTGQGCANGNCGGGACNGSCNGGCNTGTCGTGSCSTGACQAPTCQTCCPQPCGPYGKIWVSGEYLAWWSKGFYVPPLVTSSPVGTPRAQAAVLGFPNTTVLFGDDDLNGDLRSGFRLRAGAWLDNCQTCGIEGSYFFLGDANDGFSAGPSGSQIIGRPFTNITNNIPIQDAQIVNDPGQEQGNVSVNSNTSLSGFDVNIRKNCKCDCCNRIDWLAGFRYLKLEDELTISEDLTVVGTASGIPVGTRFQITDSFVTRNQFYGGQVGVAGEHRRGQYFMNWRALLAMGTTNKEVTINGSTTITPPGGPATTYPGGILALPTNMGSYSKNDFSIVPELNVNIGYAFSENLRIFGGYSFLYWSNVTRPGDAIDTTLNTSQFPPGTLVGQARPTFTWNDGDFWAQGFSLGAELRY